uniref:Uncharacterized protein n=1 Tax=Kalanchoe fedtschenkoi TaxID=63787 RepID=A0A7N0SZD9_KALFE
MLVEGGNVYWTRNEEEVEGIVVVFSWVSVEERQLRKHVDLYGSLGWNCLVCCADFLNAFHPEKATAVAFFVLSELIEKLRIKRRPVVFLSFSGGSKACLYKVFQIIQGTCDGRLTVDDNQLVRSCLSAHIYDSGPLEFSSDFAAQFTLHPTILKLPGACKLMSWFAKGLQSSLDALFLTKFRTQHAEYWQALYSSTHLGAPYLVFCSDGDPLVPYRVVCSFAHRLRNLGGDVELVKWNHSPHLGHYEQYPVQYKTAVSCILEKASSVFSRKTRELEIKRSRMDAMHDDISELFCNLQKAAGDSSRGKRRIAVETSDQYFAPSPESQQGGSSPSQDQIREGSVHFINPPSINAHSLLGQALFDGCVPKNVEGWDIKFSGTLNGQPLGTASRRSPPRGFKSFLRSKL